MMNRCLSKLVSSLKENKFVFTGEVEPEKTTDLSEMISSAKKLEKYVVACNVTDNPQSFGYISGLVSSFIMQRETGLEAIYQITCRDRNRIALLSDLLGASALNIRNVLVLTGDHTVLGDIPQAKPVFDLDSVQLIYGIRNMIDEGKDFARNKITHPPQFYLGGGVNPNSDPLEPELIKFKKKVDAGAEFFQTQVVFDIDIAKNFMREVRKFKVPVIIGIFPLRSYGVAKYFDEEVPGVKVPVDLIQNLKDAKRIQDETKRREKYMEINKNYFIDFIKEMKKTTKAAGCHVMSIGYEEIVPKLIAAVK